MASEPNQTEPPKEEPDLESISPTTTLTKIPSNDGREHISPLLLPKSNANSIHLDHAQRQHRVGLGRKLSGRSSRSSVHTRLTASPGLLPSNSSAEAHHDSSDSAKRHSHIHRDHHRLDELLTQVKTWINDEKSKQTNRRARRRHKHGSKSPNLARQDDSSLLEEVGQGIDDASSDSSMALDKLEGIMAKVMSVSTHPHTDRRGSQRRLHSFSTRKYSIPNTLGSSDTDYQDGDALVPNCETVLDNTKTLNLRNNASISQTNLLERSKTNEAEIEAWSKFKFEIVRLAHTLRLRGWRQLSMSDSRDIEVDRLSGALTNAVYVVSPPKYMECSQKSTSGETPKSPKPRRPPKKVLLRIYGPNVGHLIDREKELHILRRLARQKIGPRLLGTFTNGRFEEYFHANALTPRTMRMPDISIQIAKRMRELHSGIQLTDRERDAGPFLWQNWDKWVDRCEKIVKYIDRQVLGQNLKSDPIPSLQRRGLICGVKWGVFRKTVEKYRKFLYDQYGGSSHIKDQLVFAHNDTQYGNILRLEPPSESPLLLPQNKHKQLIVIDFEYANANMIGMEFANHFTEWCYDYHDPARSWQCNTTHYPRPEEQRRFIQAYLQHHLPHSSSHELPPSRSGSINLYTPRQTSFSSSYSATPSLKRQTSSLSSFSLDNTTAPTNPSSSSSAFPPLARTSSTSTIGSTTSNATTTLNPQTTAADAAANFSSDPSITEHEIARIAHETRLWRPAVHAQWVVWGVVQAKVPGIEEEKALEQAGAYTRLRSPTNRSTQAELFEELSGSGVQRGTMSDGQREEEEDQTIQENTEPNKDETLADEQEEEENFEYLLYSQDRALFFWADCAALGLVDLENDLPRELAERVRTKIVGY